MNRNKRMNQLWKAVLSAAIALSVISTTKPVSAASTIKVIQITATQNNSLALKSDGTVMVWGTHSEGLAKPPAGLTDVVEVFAKDMVFLARKSNGSAVAWGSTDAGATTIPAGVNRVISMSTANHHTLMVMESPLPGTGAVIAWGLNGNGQSSVPDAAKSGVTKVAAGAYYSMALKFDGTVVEWGSNGSDATPMPHLTNIVAIEAGYLFALALKSDGTVAAWGKEYNGNGILDVPSGLNDVIAISAGNTHALALKRDGTVVGWGSNEYGKATSPAGLTDVVAISAGRDHSLALKGDGTVVSWGSQTSVPGDNELSGLTLMESEPTTAFSPSVTSYHYNIAPEISTIHIKADLKDSKYSALYINDQLQTSGQMVSVSVPVNGTTIKVRVEPYMKEPKIYTLTVSRDREPPVIAFSPNGSAAPLRTISTFVQITDALSGLNQDRLEYAWTQTATTPISGWSAFSLLSHTQLAQFVHAGTDGYWYLHIRAEDHAGNFASAVSMPFLIDNTPPNLNITMKTEGGTDYVNDTWTNQPITITAAAADDLGSVADLQYTLDGGKTWLAYTGSVKLSEPGIHTLIVQAMDTAGNTKTESRSVKITNGDLKLTLTMRNIPENSEYISGEWANNSVRVSATAETGVNPITSFTFSMNGGPEDTYRPELDQTITFFQNGMNEGIFKVTDSIGNVLGVPFAINIDRTAPSVSFNPQENEIAASEVSVIPTVTDSGGSGLAVLTLEYAWAQSTITPAGGWALLDNGKELKNSGSSGDWYLHIRGEDIAGNAVSAVSGRFELGHPSSVSTINPATGTFDKNLAAQTDVETTLVLNGNELDGIYHGLDELTFGTDYLIIGHTAVIKKSYLALLPLGMASLTFKFNDGGDQVLSITIDDTTVMPGTAPYISGPISLVLNEGYEETSTGEYTIAGDEPVTVTKTSGDDKITWNSSTKKLDIAAGLTEGSYPVTLTASNGTVPDDVLEFTLTVNPAASVVIDATISPAAINYDLSSPSDVVTKITWNSTATMTDLVYDTTSLQSPDAYVIAGNQLIIKNSYLSTLALDEGDELEFQLNFDIGNPQILTVNVVDNYIPAANADLVDLTIEGVTVSGFDANTTTYEVELPYGTVSVVVGAVPDDGYAAVTVHQAPNLPGSATIDVTAEDKTTTKRYTINFTLGAEMPSYYHINLQQEGSGTVSANVYAALINTQIILSATPDSGYYLKEWQVVDGGVTITNHTFVMPGNHVTIKAIFEQTPDHMYQVTVNGSYAAVSGDGIYADGTVVAINAGSRRNYTFAGWTSADGVIFANAGRAATTFTMPADHVTVNASWRYIGSTRSSERASEPVTVAPVVVAGKPVTQLVMATGQLPATADKNGKATAVISLASIEERIREAAAKAAQLGQAASGIGLSFKITNSPNIKSWDIVLPPTVLKKLTESNVQQLELDGKILSLKLDWKSLAHIQSQSTGNVTIGVEPVTGLGGDAKALVETRPAYNISIRYRTNGTAVRLISLGSGTAVISIPYVPASQEVLGSLFGVSLDGKETAVRIAGSVYDAVHNRVIFTSKAASMYGVGYKSLSTVWTDTNTHWAKEAIDYITGRGLLEGTSNTSFSPNAAMTHEALVTALGRLIGINTKLYTTSSFMDAEASGTIHPYIEWANQTGITKNGDVSQVAPNQALTREEIALILVNYTKVTGFQLPVVREAVTYDDTSSIAERYKAAVVALQQAGIMTGKKDNQFNPKAVVSRAELAAMLYRYSKLIIDSATASGWSQNDDGQSLYYREGKAVVGWQEISSGNNQKRYYFNGSAVMITGQWLNLDGKWYYFNGDGSLAVNSNVDGYEIDAYGVRK